MDKRIGIGVIGVGLMGSMFAQMVTQLPQARLVGLHDVDEPRAKKLADSLQTRSYTSYEDLLEQSELDAVIIATPDREHLAPVKAATTRHKHILVEKPLAGSRSEAEQIVNLAKKAGVQLMVGQTLRFDPTFIAARNAVARGDIGELVHVYTRHDGSIWEGKKHGPRTTVTFFLGVHDFDALRFITGHEITKVFARRVRKVLTDLDTDDAVIASLCFDNGVIGTTEVSWYLPERGDYSTSVMVDIFGSHGHIHLEPYNCGMTMISGGKDWSRPVLQYSFEPIMYGKMIGVYQNELEHFVNCVITGQPPAVTGEDGLAAVAVAEAVEYSLREGKEILL